jgi:FtsH-binding integral membrane protein
MATQTTLNRLQTLIWVLAYGGLLTLVLGLATLRYDEETGQWLVIVGGVVAACGFVLIFVRARLRLTETS